MPDSGPLKTLAARLADTALGAVERDTLRARIAAREREQAELGDLVVAVPTRIVTDSLVVSLGGRRAILRHFDRGNTPGDLIAWLPEERIAVVGDVVVSPIPYAYNSFPHTWIDVLTAIDRLEPLILVPGHGPVFRDRAYLGQVTDLLRAVTVHVQTAWRQGKTADEATESFDFAPWRDRFAGTDPFLRQVFDGSIVRALVDRALLVAQGAL